MKLNKITETGFYTCDLKGRETIYKVIKNTDEEWLKEYPTHTLLINGWYLDHIDEENRKCYVIYSGDLVAIENAEDFDVDKIKDTKYKMTDSYGIAMREDKPSRLEQANSKIDKIKEAIKYSCYYLLSKEQCNKIQSCSFCGSNTDSKTLDRILQIIESEE